MNRNHHRIVFNAARGQLMAVSETATACTGSAATGESPASTTKHWRSAGAALLTALATLPAQAQISADPTAAGNLRPTVLTAPNGVPLVNIQTPSAAGVSRNVYRQFDVGTQGAILNNSRTNVQTQLGGWVQGNPWLARGPARVILNEINSRQPSHLNGWVEVGARGDSGDEAIESLEAGSCDERRLTMQQARDTFEPVYWAFARRQGLTAAELVLAATLSTAVAAANCRPAMGLKATTHLAHYSMLEASKTAPGPRPKIAEGKAHLHKLAAILPPLTWSRRLALWLKP